jgi:hypothetical protein
MTNTKLNTAKKAKNDEFYTQLADIENELEHYKKHLQGKVIFCNCDNPEWSNFWKYFYLNFDFLGLKALISTHFEKDKPCYKLECRGGRDDQGELITEITMLSGNGDFRSQEVIEVLKESDIVVTNPPFSLFREYVAQLIEYDKQFLIIGNINAITYKEIFPLIKDNKMWVGHACNKTMIFRIPDHYKIWDYISNSDEKYGKVPVTWFTNLAHSKRNRGLILHKTHQGTNTLYPKYDNYDAIEVSKVKDIPLDYQGVMGVPITFLDKYNPEQFEIVGNAGSYSVDGYSLASAIYVSGRKIYKRILIKRKVNNPPQTYQGNE